MLNIFNYLKRNITPITGTSLVVMTGVFTFQVCLASNSIELTQAAIGAVICAIGVTYLDYK